MPQDDAGVTRKTAANEASLLVKVLIAVGLAALTVFLFSQQAVFAGGIVSFFALVCVYAVLADLSQRRRDLKWRDIVSRKARLVESNQNLAALPPDQCDGRNIGRLFHRIVDLGRWWQKVTGLPLPLGGNVIRRELGPPLMTAVTAALRESIQYGLEHREEALAYAMQFARDLDTPSADKFVGMYVNERTLDYGPDGREAVRRLLDMGHKAGVIGPEARVDWIG